MKAICFDEMTYAGICTSDAHMGSPIWYSHEDGPVAHWPASSALPDNPQNGGEWRQYDWSRRDSAQLEPWNDDVSAAVGRGRKVRVE